MVHPYCIEYNICRHIIIWTYLHLHMCTCANIQRSIDKRIKTDTLLYLEASGKNFVPFTHIYLLIKYKCRLYWVNENLYEQMQVWLLWC